MLYRSCCGTVVLLIVTAGSSVKAQYTTGWRSHDWDRPEPKVVTPGESNLPLAAPSDAIVLFDGKDLSQWCDSDGNEAKWIVRDGVMESKPGSGYVFTRKAFGDCQLHVEWASPEKVEGSSQGRGNSGVFLMGLFEIQVLDSFDNRTYADGHAASIYGQYPPLVNASRKPGQWQSYEIIFRRPRYDTSGQLISPARITVLQNGVLVQDNVAPLGPTSWLQHTPYKATADRLPLSLQDHGNPVRYRNIWIRPLNEWPALGPAQPYEAQVEQLSIKQLDAYAGTYKGGSDFRIKRVGRQLAVDIGGRDLEMIAGSKTEFGLRYTAAKITFELDSAGNPIGMTYQLAGEKKHARRSDK